MSHIIHFFGELEADLSLPRKEIFEQVFNISESCGYMSYQEGDAIFIDGRDCEQGAIKFDNTGKAVKAKVHDGSKWTILFDIERDD